MAWRNGRWEPDIPAPPPPRNVPGAPPPPPGSSTLPQNNNRTAGAVPPPPPPTPRLPTPPGAANTGNAANVSAANAAYNQGQRGSDPNAVFGPGGAGGHRQWYNQQQGGNRPEDMERFSDETLAGWDQYMIKEGPNAGKYRSMRGAEGFFDKPTECPPGMVPGGPNETDGCIPNPDAGAGGAGGQGGSGGGGGANQGYLDEMSEYWKGLVKNQDTTRFTPEVMAALEADQFARARAQEKNQLEEAKADMAQRGVTGSANQNATLRGIRGATGAQIMSTRAQVMKAKVDADYQDKQAAIKNAQDWVNSMRDYMLRTDMNAIQREQIAAQIRLAQMNIKAQSEQLEQQYQNNLSMAYLTGGTGI